MSGTTHEYTSHLVWTGNHGTGTASYAGYGREHEIHVIGKPSLAGSADPVFRGDPARHNPEDLFVAAVAACHMLAYLALCARHGVVVLDYEDRPRGILVTHAGGGGKFDEVVLSPVVTIADGVHEALALELHDTAHERCFIARSCAVPIRHEATVRVAPAEMPA
ncbi:MAG TPA: OsmC family protein [Longimicrobiales bacterium]